MTYKVEACVECVYWSDVENNEGLCRHKSPVIITQQDTKGLWPTTKSDDWCGQGSFKLTTKPFKKKKVKP